MGRWSFSSKQEADYLKKIDISWLKQQGLLNGWHSATIKWTNPITGEKTGSVGIIIDTHKRYIRLYYTQTDWHGKKKEFDYKVPLTTTPCNYGGVRYWFICPLVKNGQPCGRRVRVLYKAGDYFGCRHCYELTYSSKNENRRDKIYPLFLWFKNWKKIEELERKIKRPYYKGKLTRKQKRLEEIKTKMMFYLDLIKKERL